MSLSMEYIAGFFDGEGSIGIARKTRKGIHSYVLTVQCGQVNPVVLYIMEERWGGSVHPCKTAAGRAYHRWQIHSGNALVFLKEVGPHLLIKQAQAELAIEFYSVNNNSVRLHKHMPRLKRTMIQTRRRRCYEEMTKLNLRGERANG